MSGERLDMIRKICSIRTWVYLYYADAVLLWEEAAEKAREERKLKLLGASLVITCLGCGASKLAAVKVNIARPQ